MYIPLYTGLFMLMIAFGNIIWLSRILIKEIKVDIVKKRNFDVSQIVLDADLGKMDEQLVEI
jgi:hypothetical protein